MKLLIALVFIALAAGAFSQQVVDNTCYERVNHLIDRSFFAAESKPDVDGYLQIFAYLEDRLLHNKTYTKCYNYTNQLCQLATTQLLPKLFNYVKNNSTNLTAARINYHYVQRTTNYFLNRCGLGNVVGPDVIDAEEFQRATCRNTAERIYGFLTALNKHEVHTLSNQDLVVLFRTFSTMLRRAHERVCLSPQAYTPRVLFIGVREFVASQNLDKHVLVELWRFISYLGVDYLRDAGLNHNLTRICGNEIASLRDYLNLADGYPYYRPFVDHLKTLAYDTKCFRRTDQCRVFRQRLNELIFENDDLQKAPQKEFDEWWSIIRFNVKQYIYDCYYRPRLDFGNPIWTATYNYSDAQCTTRVAEATKTLRGTFFTDVNRANITFPALYYFKTELNDVADKCFNHNNNCTNYRIVFNYLVNRTLGRDATEDTAPSWDYDINGNFFLLQLNALKWIHHCTPKPSDVIIPNVNKGCARYITTLRDGLNTATSSQDLVDALLIVRENKKIIDQYRDCNVDNGANRLCLDLTEQVRSLYVKTLFTSDIEEFKLKIRQVSEALKDVSDECKPLNNNI